MKPRIFFSAIAVILIGWWMVQTGLQNKADNEGTAALREVMREVQDQVPEELDRSMYANVTLTSENNRRIVYTYTYLIRQSRTSTPVEADRACGANEAHASRILTAMESESIRNPEIRIEYRRTGGSLDFACTYP